MNELERLKAIIIDDEAPARALIREYLSGHADVEVVAECANGFEAVKAASEFKPGPFGSRGLGQLAYDKAMLVLAASQTDEFAVGLGRLKHGLLTYTLLEGMEPAKADQSPRAAGEGGLLMLSGLLKYAADQAPEVYKAAKSGELERRGAALAAEPLAGVATSLGSRNSISACSDTSPASKARSSS